MLEKIKTLLDSWCYVEVEFKKTVAGKIKKGDVKYGMLLYWYDEDSLIGDWDFIHIYFDRMYLKNNWTDVKILSIKPIARPLYNYKVGDKVVVLDNYEGKYLIFWEIVEITNIWNGTIEVEKNKDIYSIDTRCIAPVLD